MRESNLWFFCPLVETLMSRTMAEMTLPRAREDIGMTWGHKQSYLHNILKHLHISWASWWGTEVDTKQPKYGTKHFQTQLCKWEKSQNHTNWSCNGSHFLMQHFCDQVPHYILTPIYGSSKPLTISIWGFQTRVKKFIQQDFRIEQAYCPTADQIADIFTKPLPIVKHSKFVKDLFYYSKDLVKPTPLKGCVFVFIYLYFSFY